ncbi:Uncharacterized membrane protein YhaH, DUF805 family [Cribrihabitans marinus]|uniref:Uncharacterized membrane protein YhaH, DUF805 family n=1 Tax=Cribrihabitans marinus TaxID=1227549 RepID=A0A1H7DK24_9RHOB|nr:DUF805 domain-containing protein [Cribrihabitans marinus]GGH38649.1 hypothetical protein GCM10010973_34020 [Cribrihabitans marinus]SEJ99982.1 Uncharacterized membrane protein YhaH, DUF805 family [Cribrihabitans marinus]
MTFSTAIRTCFAKYVTFSGRASRPEYWYFFLFVFLVNSIAGTIDLTLFGTVSVQETSDMTAVAASSPRPIQSIVSLIVFLPHLAVAWRRMHDTGRSGLYALFPILLMIGAGLVLVFGIGLASHFQHGGSLDLLFTRATLIVLIPTLVVLFLSPLLVIWWLTRPSQPGTNEYGPNPHEVTQ